MTSSGSSKDLSKALNGFFQAPTLPLPPDITTIVASYLEKHEKADEGSGERLGDELLGIWEKSVQDHPEKYAAFIAVLRQLRPGLRNPARVFKWWDRLLDPVLDHADREKGLAREVMDHTLDLFSADEYDDPTAWSEDGLAPLVNRLLVRWMEVRETKPDLRPAADLKEQMIKDALMAFGKRDPKGFLAALNSFVVKREHRNAALSLLCGFVSGGPPHLYLILQTPLFGNILHSLQKDESTTTVDLALIALVMILPCIPSSLVPFLSTLFNIYARLLFWDRDSYFAQQHVEMGIDNEAGGVSWDKSLLDPDNDGHSLSYLPEYFAVLYGLYPINFVDYIRKPHRYLRHANNAEDIDVQAVEIRDRSEQFRKQHLLHPNFYNLTIDSEKTDMSRWIKCEAGEVLADCLALVVGQTPDSAPVRPPTLLPGAGGPAMGEGFELDAFDPALLGSSAHGHGLHPVPSTSSMSISRGNHTPSVRRGSQSSQPSAFDMSEARHRAPGDDSPTLPPSLGQSAALGQAHETAHSAALARGGLHQSLANDSVPSLALNPQEQAGEKSPLLQARGQTSGLPRQGSSNGAEEQLALLQHHRLRVINDLQYERFIKEQHMIHMGELRRRQIRVSATEAETQNLVMANRSLKQRLDEAKRGEAQTKKEFDNRRSMTKKWESDLSNKLRALREEQKKWNAEGSELRQQLSRAQEECDNLRRIVSEAEGKRLESEQNLEAADISTGMMDRLKAEIARLSASEREFQGKETRMEISAQETAAAEARAHELAAEMAAREEQLQKAERQYAAQTEDLERQLAKALQDSASKRSGDVAAAYENALSSARAKNAALQKQYENLTKKCTALESSLLDMQCEAEQKSRRAEWSPLADGEGGEPSMTGRSPISIQSRQRGFSESETAESLTRSMTMSPPLERVATSPGSGGNAASSPPGQGRPGEASGSSKISTSPHAERYFGRGGVQNAARKGGKDTKKEEKGEKKDKDKKPGGMRAMRGFV
ncbi:Hamartin protein-domain-containing protein [Staphylotrichum tortipilum]|uniref:Hamartin protein-domain-containing protein n=1 Tax=Staphylotrichum tortipilum TaxID=2831512 RepID=A0AAN6MKD5_9PEZI|nr:Hamartin protein-domain-containing protein [Staphylotrichum longicolle]